MRTGTVTCTLFVLAVLLSTSPARAANGHAVPPDRDVPSPPAPQEGAAPPGKIIEEEVDLDALEDPGETSELWEELKKVRIFGYGELHYNNPRTGTLDDGEDSTAEVHRFVIGVGYDWTDEIHLEAEFDFEHSFEEPEVEYAHVTIDAFEDIARVRLGGVLVPVGFLNQHHEPPTFWSVERPLVDTFLIPTTWQEIGAGIFGSPFEFIDYEVYAMTPLDPTGFSVTSGIRGGRTKMRRGPADGVAWVTRLNYRPVNGTTLGFSQYDAWIPRDEGGPKAITVSIQELDARLRYFGFELRTVGVVTIITGTSDLPELDPTGTPTGRGVAKIQWGFYAELAFHFQKLFQAKYLHDLVPFVRYEYIDTQARVHDQYDRASEGKRNILIVGLAHFIHPDVALKADVEQWWDGTGDAVTRVNLGLGFQY